MRVRRLCLAAVVAVASAAAVASPLAAQKMLVREPSHYLNYGYGYSSWNTFTGLFDAEFGAANIDVVASVAPGGLTGYAALMLTLPDLPDAPYILTAAEQAEITTFLNGGGRLYAFGENNSWNAWNNNIAGLVGATVSGTYSGNANALFNTGILQGVNTVNYPAGGAFSSLGATGVPLFDTNVAALFGAGNNALFILDVNLCDDSNINSADNLKFCTNIAGFLGGSVPPIRSVPEPGSIALLATGLVALGAVVRRRRS